MSIQHEPSSKPSQMMIIKCDIIGVNGDIIGPAVTEIEMAQCEVSKVMVPCEHKQELCSNPFQLKIF